MKTTAASFSSLRAFVLSFASAFLAVGAVFAAEGESPKIGETAPDFALPNLDGREIKLSELRESGPVVFVMLRGWPGYQCPICTRQVGEFVTRADDFKARGATVLLVYPGPSKGLEDHGREFIDDSSLPDHFRFVLDSDYAVTNLYGLRWEASAETAYPSTFVIGKDGVVKYGKVSKTHGGRASADEVLKALDQLQ